MDHDSKLCTGCQQTRPFAAFVKDKRGEHGLSRYCRNCPAIVAMTGEKSCSRCGASKPLTEFHVDSRATDGHYAQCKTCNQAYRQARMEEDPEHERALKRAADQRRRQENPGKSAAKSRRQSRHILAEVIAHYGGKCACCGSTYDLSVDHVYGGGREHRKQFKSHGSFYYWLKRNDWPAGFQVLCLPCNTSKGSGTHCALIHDGKHHTGLGWPNDDGRTCAGTPARRKLNGTGSVSGKLRGEIVRQRAYIAQLEDLVRALAARLQ